MAAAFLASGLAVGFLPAQQSDEVRHKPVEIHPAEESSPAPSETPAAKKKKSAPTKTSPSPKPKASVKAKPSAKEADEDSDKSPAPSASPKKKKRAAETDEATPKPKKSPSPASKGKAKAKATPKKKKKSPEADDEETPARKGAKKAPGKGEGSPEKPKRSPTPSETPVTKAAAPSSRAATVPRTAAAPTPSATAVSAPAVQPQAAPAQEAEQLTIQKSGYEKPHGFWSRVFGASGGRQTSSGAGYRYLSASVRAAIDRVSPDRRNPRWQMIVVHNSGTRQGNARVFDYYHRHVRHMQNGLAYHFVIGNGTSTRNGEIEIGDRWRRQINGGHVHSDYLNNIALGICLVGDFNRDQPTRAQLDCCEELIRYLRQRCGKFDSFHYPVVKPHREANPPRWGTDCPGNAFPYPWFRRFRE
jgi:hypothetical protein